MRDAPQSRYVLGQMAYAPRETRKTSRRSMLGSLSSNFAELNPGERLLAAEYQSRASYCFHVRMGFDEGHGFSLPARRRASARAPDAAGWIEDS